MWAQFPEAVRDQIQRDRAWMRPSAYGGDYPITRALIEDGRKHLILSGPIALGQPIRLLHGQDDPDVPWQHSLRIAERITSQDVEVTLIKGGDHRLSTPENLALLGRTLGALLGEDGA
jgi:pimeloyl-ACP methyl ester carboxylesterase